MTLGGTPAAPVPGIGGHVVALLYENVNVVSASGAAVAIPDPDQATLNTITLDADCVLTFPAPGAGKSLLVELVQDSTGGRTATWPASVTWAAGAAPLLSGAGHGDLFSFVCLDGVHWLGVVDAQDY